MKLFKERLKNGLITCFKDTPGHETCSTYKAWKSMHVVDASALKEEASSKARSMYIPLSQDVVVNGNIVHIKGGINPLVTNKHPLQESILTLARTVSSSYASYRTHFGIESQVA